MIKWNNWFIIGIAIVIAACIWIKALKQQTEKRKTHIVSNVFKGRNGWGYDILVNDTLFIHQETVPASAGNKGFQTRKQAEQTALLIINKMKRRQLPSVTTFELQQILSNKTERRAQRKPK